MPEESEIWQLMCSRCGGRRNCKRQAKFIDHAEDFGFTWVQEWRIFQCCGCDYTFLHITSTNSEDYYEDENGNNQLSEAYTYWPALAKRKRPDWIGPFGIEAVGADKLDDALLEVYTALENDLFVLGAIGLRTCFDVASGLLGVDTEASFAKKLKALVDKNHIREADTDRLDLLIEAGNASAHRGWKPSAKDLGTITEILEHFIYDAFVAPYRKSRLDPDAAKIKKAVPMRKEIG